MSEDLVNDYICLISYSSENMSRDLSKPSKITSSIERKWYVHSNFNVKITYSCKHCKYKPSLRVVSSGGYKFQTEML